MSDKIEKMTDDDFKKIMQQLGMPESMSLYSALKQVENHTWQAARTVPEGFVMVPVEPTKGMVMAGYHPDFKYAQRVEMYKAMLSAAPEGKK